MIVALFVGALIGEVPLFCKEDCSVHLDGIRRQRVYLSLEKPLSLSIYNTETIEKLDIAIATPVGGQSGHYHTSSSSPEKLNLQTLPALPKPAILFDPFYHIAKTVLQQGSLQLAANVVHEIGFNRNQLSNETHNKTKLMVTLGTRYEPSFMELVSMPRTQFYLHGSYWSQTSYWYVYAITTGVLYILYGIFARARPWQYLALASMAAFTTVFATQFHQSLLVFFRVQELTPEISRGVFLNALLANMFPVLLTLFFMYYGKLRPKSWGVLASVLGLASFFFVGAGWFVGPACLTLGGLLCLMDRIALTTISVVK